MQKKLLRMSQKSNHSTSDKMKTFVIEERYVGYRDVTIRAESEEEAKSKYELGHYDICEVNTCDDTYDHTFMSIVEYK